MACGNIKTRTKEAQIENIKNLYKSKAYAFNLIKSSLLRQSSSDYTLNKAIIFRKNYLEVMKKYEHLDNYNLLIEKLESIENPIKFFEFVGANELTQDLTYQSDNVYTQEAFNYFLQSLGIIPQIDSETEVNNM